MIPAQRFAPVCLLLAACAAISVDPVGSAGEEDAARQAPTGDARESIAERIEGLAPMPGFLDAWWDEAEGRALIAPPLDLELLHMVSLPAGLGSNRVGLDRAQLGDRAVVVFRRHGPKVLLVAPNLAWMSSAETEVEQRAARDSFAESVLFAFDVAAEDEDGRVLVDASDFLLTDAHDVAAALRRSGQGSFRLDGDRSVLLPERSRGFADNTEIEALLTFAGDQPGREVMTTAADASSVSLRVRHSFVRLPDLDASAFRPRKNDPRAGFFGASQVDVSAPIDAPRVIEWAARHDLRPGGPPITYYIDRAAPEPVRTALVEGARYWEPVFAKAGFPGGFRVELLPEDADPQDVRYNVVTWVHRSTRGWSYGDSVVDPRTGQILKGHVSLGALRVRQDVLLAEGLLAPYAEEDRDARVQDMALARIRQLSAHEIGHTLGLRHNFAASTADRASVMDYPPPRVLIDDDGELDLSQAYAPGCGRWDELAIRYGYGWCEAEDEERFRAESLKLIETSGVPYATDSDARGRDRAHPSANLWDDGDDPVAALRHAMRVRRRAIEGFGEAAIQRGEPLSELETALVPLYFHHRYQLEAAVRQLGGVDYRHAVRAGDLQAGVAPVAADVQRAALKVVLATVEPEFLSLEPELLALIPPPAPGGDLATERFSARGLPLDAKGVEAAAIRMTLELLLDPTRAARLVDQNVRDAEMPGFDHVVESLIAKAWAGPGERGELRAQVLERLIDLALDEGVPQRVQRVAWKGLDELRRFLDTSVDTDTIEEKRQALWERARLDAFFEDPFAPRTPRALPEIPDGSPIGCSHG